MVSSVSSIPSFSPSTYLSQLKSGSKLTAVANVAPAKPKPAATPPPASPPSSTGSNNLLGLSSDVLSLLQGTSASSDNMVSSLLGVTPSSTDLTSNLFGAGSSNDLVSNLLGGSSGVLSGLLARDSSLLPTAQALQSAGAVKANRAAGTSPVQSLISSYNTRLNANNATLLQNAQNVVNAGKSLLA